MSSWPAEALLLLGILAATLLLSGGLIVWARRRDRQAQRERHRR